MKLFIRILLLVVIYAHVDALNAQIQSQTTHPEFSINMFKEMAPAYPSEEISFMSIPVANAQGSAKTSYEIKIPPGRQGMMPDVSLLYDSEGGMGWCGMGWDLNYPAITIDTRWGVPRYDADYESETYLIEGQQVAPVAHREDWVSREAERSFYLRVQDRYEKITRHGNSPKNYWWEIATPDGLIRYFGGDPETGFDSEYAMTDYQGNVAQWAIKKVVDRHGNFMRYAYSEVSHPGVPGSSLLGKSLYLKSIAYTGFENTDGPFLVTFIRDREQNEAERKDIGISARLGFKQVVADLLRRIEISMNNEQIRAYELQYSEGAFGKTLLSTVICLSESNEEFYRHELEYFDDVRIDGDYYPFSDPEIWDGQQDNIQGGLAAANPLFPDEVSLLGGSYSSDWSLGGAATVGLIGNLLTKTNTVGANYNFGKSTGSGLLAFVDINGDGLPDKVYQKGNQLFYRPNQFEVAGEEFGPSYPIAGISQFSKATTSSHAVGAEAHPALAFVGYSYNNITTDITTYFSDFNGDGLIDVVFNGVVYFNHIGVNGHPIFTQSSDDTPSPIKVGGDIDNDLVVVDSAAQEELIDQSPLHDIVRMWEAPYDGTIRISGPVQLLEDLSPESQNYPYKDGVRVSIQVRDQVLWSTNIAPDDFSSQVPFGVNSISVDAEDCIYFRVQSIDNGAYDQVTWDPRISYVGESQTALEPTQKPFHVFQASDDFLLASCQTVTMPLDGEVEVVGPFIKPVLSDDLFVQVVREDLAGIQTVVDNAFYPANGTADIILNFNGIEVDSGDVFYFRINCRTKVNWSEITWMPQVAYTAADNGTVVLGPNDERLVSFCPAPEYQIYSKVIEKTEVYTAPQSGTLEVAERLLFFGGTGTGTLSVKKEKELLGYSPITVVNGVVNQLSDLLVDVSEGDELFIEYHVATFDLADRLIRSSVRLTMDGDNENLDVGFHSKRSDEDIIFGPMFRNWGLFAYNGNRDRASMPIDEDELEIDDDAMDVADGAGDIGDPDDIGSTYSAADEPFVLLVADVKNQYWIGSDDLTYIARDTLSSSRMGEDNVLPPDFSSSGGLLVMPPIKSVSRVHSVAGGASVGPVGPGGSVAFNTTKNLLDVLDLNGDSYPDIVSDVGFQFTTMCGGLEETMRTHTFGHHEATSFAWGVSANVDFVHSSATNSGDASQGGTSSGKRGGLKSKGSQKIKNAGKSRRSGKAKSTVNKSSKKSKDSSRASQNGIGIDAGFTNDRDTTDRTWLDINGDGLLDMVYKNGTAALNLGYSFSPAEPWGHDMIRTGLSEDYGGGLGVNLFSGSIVSGISINRTDNQMESSLQDVNGDGLVDLITNIQPLRVRLNRGNGFDQEVTWHGAQYIENGSSTGESVNAAFTVCIPIVILGIKICVNPSTSKGQGVSRVTQVLADADGDGFVDYLESSENNELRVRKSTISRTNLLKTIHRPMGGRIDLNYAIAGNNYDLPYSRWVMSNVTVHDGVTGDGENESKIAIEYRNGKYDRHEREFYGFGDVRVHELDGAAGDAVYRTNHYAYDVSSYYRKGLRTEYKLTDATGRPFQIETSTYELQDVVSGMPLAQQQYTDDKGMAAPRLVKKKNRYFEGEPSQFLDHDLNFVYDKYGNIIQSVDQGNGSAEDELIREVTYYSLDNLHYYQAIKSEQLKSSAGVLRWTNQEIDDKGNVLVFDEWVEADKFITEDYTYDTYGNVLSFKRPANQNGQRLQYDYSYDEHNIYVTEIQDSYGYSSTASYDPRHGRMTSQTDINRQTVAMAYDKNGRLEMVFGPSDSIRPIVTMDYSLNQIPAYATMRRYDEEHEDEILSAVFMDGFERAIETQHMGIVTSSNGIEENVMHVSESEYYDAFGRVITSFYPTTIPGWNIAFTNQAETTDPTSMTYDVLDRPLQITHPDGRVSSYAYALGANNLGEINHVVTRTDAKGLQSNVYSDQIGREIATERFGENGEIWTNSVYNAISEKVRDIDTESNEINYTYDGVGRLVQVDHPDGGTRKYTFDNAGNLIRKSTSKIASDAANDGVVEYAHDFERLIEINYPKNYQNKVQVHYGDTAAMYNRIGRVVLREDASGGEEYFYGKFGEIIKSVRTVLVHRNNMQTFVTTHEYDDWGRTQTLTFPDGEVLDYAYNRAGVLDRMTGRKSGVDYVYLDKVGYNQWLQPVRFTYGNGVLEQRTYDLTRRHLADIKIEKDDVLVGTVAYEYDNIDNVSQYSVEAIDQDGGVGGRVEHAYTYDDLSRLTSATGALSGQSAETYELSMAYDDVSNLMDKKIEFFKDGNLIADRSYQKRFSYESDQPHAPNIVSGREFRYDPSGNISSTRSTTTFDFRQYRWDEENRLAAISNNGYISEFTYDGFGERIVSSHGNTHGVFIDGEATGVIDHVDQYTISVNPYFTKTKEGFTKHYFFDGQRFLSKVGNGRFRFDAIQRGELATAGQIDYQGRRRLLEKEQDDYYREAGIPPGAPTLLGLVVQPEFTGNGLPSELDESYDQTPPGWPIAVANEDTTGAPGHPVYFVQPTDSVVDLQPGYAFDSTGTDIYPEVSTNYLHHDHVGSVVFVTDYVGLVREFISYTPHGNVFVKESNIELDNPFSFNGKVFDKHTGLHYFGARYFDATLGMWANIDPFVNVYPGISPYAFTFQNPINYVDNDGKLPGRPYLSPDKAAKAFLIEFNPVSIQLNREFGAAIYYDPVGGYYSFTKPELGSLDGVSIPDVPFRTKMVGDVHTHGAYVKGIDSDEFSSTDIDGIRDMGHVGYLGTPSGKALRFDANDGPDGKITTLTRRIAADPKHPKFKNSKRRRKRFGKRTQQSKTKSISLHLGKKSSARY